MSFSLQIKKKKDFAKYKALYRIARPIWVESMPSIKIKHNESFDVGLRKFKRACERSGVIPEIRKREFYEKPTAVRKRKAAAAVKRNYKRVMKDSFSKLK